MYASEHGAAEVASLAALWGPRLVRFYFYICADQALAESSAIETVAEAIRSRKLNQTADAIVHLAVVKCMTLPHYGSSSDRIARALTSLPATQRIAIALVKGMGVGIEELAEATGTTTSESRRLLADGLLELHRLLVKDQDTKLENTSES